MSNYRRVAIFGPKNPRDFEVFWAFASMDSADSSISRQFFATLADAAVPKLRDRCPRHVAITCWALAKVGKSWFMYVYVNPTAMERESPELVSNYIT